MSIEAGLNNEMEWIVTEDHLASHIASGLVDALSTPSLVAFCEECARLIVDPLLPPGQKTVGTRIDLQHLAPTPPGMRVTVHAELVEVDGRKLRFRIEARDPVEKIGEAEHERFIIDSDRFARRLNEKTAR